MTDKESFRLGYAGPALDGHEMNVRDFAPALLALGELVENANQILNGERIGIAVNIKATEPGSVVVVLTAAQSLLAQAQSLFSSDTVTAIVNAKELLGILGLGGGGTIALIKWLKKRPIRSVVQLDTGDFKVEVEDGEVRIASQKEIKLFGFLNIRKNIEAVVSAPLRRAGVDSVKLEYNGKTEQINKEEADYFVAPEVSEELIDERDIQSNLQIVNVSFQEDGKWRFADGASTFYAEITDEEFLTKVSQNEKYFAKDDVLEVILKRKQFIVSGQIKTEYIVTKVLNHRSAAIQIKLPFNSGDVNHS